MFTVVTWLYRNLEHLPPTGWHGGQNIPGKLSNQLKTVADHSIHNNKRTRYFTIYDKRFPATDYLINLLLFLNKPWNFLILILLWNKFSYKKWFVDKIRNSCLILSIPNTGGDNFLEHVAVSAMEPRVTLSKMLPNKNKW